ncbi:hypothetical protein BDQ12DRAFT_766509 [Crucibulum laeve]|uniref:Phosphatidylglycerol lysyltransferase C-terminal domain-containing protein n=1 Tax=Crucibulum laeve TaxID=68775 RepID=A0A5C3LK23_9AGAR|nr:hypothetical protein BDQ12DRAFT_766509 [Crucibulum laeve]
MTVSAHYGKAASDPATFDKSTIADLVAKYGSSSTTAWLEFERYKIWRPAEPIPESEFPPVQGYMQKDPYVFAWGNPLVSSPTALSKTAHEFIGFVEQQGLRPIWCCVDRDLEEILGNEFDWSTVSCIYEDVVDPEKVIEMTSPEAKGQEGQKIIKDLKKNLNRAEKYDVHVAEVKDEQWTNEDKRVVEEGIRDWKANKSGVQIASTTLQPWLDQEHRRYWIARKDGHVIGILILTPIMGGSSWQIKNAVSFPSAPKGTSEALIYNALKDLHVEQEAAEDDEKKRTKNRVTVTFGISASDSLKPVQNLGGWKVSALSKTYGKVASTAGLIKRGEFRSKFASEPETMYVCYPPDGFGLDGVNALLKVLRK